MGKGGDGTVPRFFVPVPLVPQLEISEYDFILKTWKALLISKIKKMFLKHV